MDIISRKMVVGVFFAIFAVTSALAGAPAYAQVASTTPTMVPMKATLVKVEGTVMVQIGSAAPRQANLNDVVQTGDRLETKAGSRAELRIDNGNIMTLGPNTELVLASLASNPGTGEYENIMESKFGKLRAKVAKMQGQSKFQVKTPNAICGARGTTFYLVISGGETRVFVSEGTVGVDNPVSGNTYIVVQDAASISTADGTVREATGDEKAQILADYNAFLEASVGGGTEEGGGEEGNPNAPSMTDDTQSVTENPPSQT
jgi:hypothetical protein